MYKSPEHRQPIACHASLSYDKFYVLGAFVLLPLTNNLKRTAAAAYLERVYSGIFSLKTEVILSSLTSSVFLFITLLWAQERRKEKCRKLHRDSSMHGFVLFDWFQPFSSKAEMETNGKLDILCFVQIRVQERNTYILLMFKCHFKKYCFKSMDRITFMSLGWLASWSSNGATYD